MYIECIRFKVLVTALLGEVAKEFLEGLSPPTSHESLMVFKPLPCRLESPFLTGSNGCYDH